MARTGKPAPRSRLSASATPDVACWLAILALTCLPSASLRADFVRGDADRNGRLGITDAVTAALAIFGRGEPLGCADAADANDDGRIDVRDIVAALRALFRQEPLPYPGHESEGPDPTCDPLDCADAVVTTPAVVINEIQYNPATNQLNEFIELHNRTSVALGLAGYAFRDGVVYAFPADAVIPADGFLIVARAPGRSTWRDIGALGPWDGALADGGERLTLRNADCVGESLRYDDRAPWPAGADGYGASLERIDASLPAGDVHAWRAALDGAPTPARANSSRDTPPRPLATGITVSPTTPSSTDAVRLEVRLDVVPSRIARAEIRREVLSESLSQSLSVSADVAADGEHASIVTARLPATASQTLVRWNLLLELDSGETVVLPHAAERPPVFSYFAYDGEVPSVLPVLWAFPPVASGIVDGGPPFSGAVIQETVDEPPQVLDGAAITPSNQGLKLRFTKGGEYRDERTVNILAEEGNAVQVGGVGGPYAPYLEHFGYSTYRALGALAPEARWFRMVDFSTTDERQTQRVVFQQVNERFLLKSGLDPDGDLYKLDLASFSKRTNTETGSASLGELVREISSSDPERQRRGVLERLDIENVRLFSVVSVLIENDDTYWNNMFLYNDLSPGGRWMVFPWDLDTLFRSGSASAIDLPAHRGPISAPFHAQPDLHAQFLEELARHVAPDGPYTLERVLPRIDATEALLLEDLDLLEASVGHPRPERRESIRAAYGALRAYVAKRIQHVRGTLVE